MGGLQQLGGNLGGFGVSTFLAYLGVRSARSAIVSLTFSGCEAFLAKGVMGVMGVIGELCFFEDSFTGENFVGDKDLLKLAFFKWVIVLANLMELGGTIIGPLR